MKNFDEIILELPEVNLNEKRTRYGQCDYGRDPWGNCYDMAEVVGYGQAPGSSTPQWVIDMANGQGGPGDSGGGNGGPMISQDTGHYETRECAGCYDAVSPRSPVQPWVNQFLHNPGCGGLSGDPALRHKVWVDIPCE